MIELTVGIRDLKSRLSEYMRQVRQGQVILITDHGRPIGRLLPVESSMEEQIKGLCESGLLSWNGIKLTEQVASIPNTSEHLASDILVEMRK